jgi:GDPmannose 4,6-dehydratase
VTKRALIIGVLGQDGSYLADLLLSKGYEVFGMHRPRSAGVDLSNLLPETREGVALVEADINDSEALHRAIEISKPDEIYNFAAVSYVPSSWPSVMLTLDTNALGPTRLFEAVRVMCPQARVYQASTSEMFGNAPPPQNELTPMVPVSPYGVAKLAAHRMAHVYRLSYGLFISCGICFNHESPRRGMHFVSRKVARKVAEIRMGLAARLHLGDITARRDWGFAGDYVEAMWRMLQQDAPDDFVVAQGRSHSVKELVVLAFQAIGEDDWTQFVTCEEDLVRPTEIRRLVGDSTKARRILGWVPTTDFQSLVRLMVEAELEVLRNQT